MIILEKLPFSVRVGGGAWIYYWVLPVFNQGVLKQIQERKMERKICNVMDLERLAVAPLLGSGKWRVVSKMAKSTFGLLFITESPRPHVTLEGVRRPAGALRVSPEGQPTAFIQLLQWPGAQGGLRVSGSIPSNCTASLGSSQVQAWQEHDTGEADHCLPMREKERDEGS